VIISKHGFLSLSGITFEFFGFMPTQKRIASPSTYRAFSSRRIGSTPGPFPEINFVDDGETDKPKGNGQAEPTNQEKGQFDAMHRRISPTCNQMMYETLWGFVGHKPRQRLLQFYYILVFLAVLQSLEEDFFVQANWLI